MSQWEKKPEIGCKDKGREHPKTALGYVPKKKLTGRGKRKTEEMARPPLQGRYIDPPKKSGKLVKYLPTDREGGAKNKNKSNEDKEGKKGR